MIQVVLAQIGGHLIENTAQNCSKYYTVQVGDTCDSIWKQSRLLGLESLLDTNHLIDCRKLMVNQVLCVDGSKENSRCSLIYQVKPGDSCWSVALDHNISVGRLVEINGRNMCDENNRIYIGQHLCVSQDAPTTSIKSTSTSNAILEAHNRARAEQNIKKLEWSKGLEAQARSYANQLANSKCILKHQATSKRQGQGENLYMSFGSKNITCAVDAWYREKYSWYYGSRVLNHYTQVMWSGTRLVGCASSSGTGCQVVVCRYKPAGNVIGVNPCYTGGHLVPFTNTCNKFYAIQKGDTCDALWKAHGLLSIESLKERNPVMDCSKLMINQEICIDGENDDQYCGIKYTVKPNDSCWSVSKKNNLTLTQLEKLNPHIHCSSGRAIYIGQVVCLKERESFTVFDKEEDWGPDPDTVKKKKSKSNKKPLKKPLKKPVRPIKKPVRPLKPIQKPQKPKDVYHHGRFSYSKYHDLNDHSAWSILEAHNQARSEKGLGLLSWSPALARQSLKYAKKLAARNNCHIYHSSRLERGPVGENLSMKGRYGPMARGIDGWYNEKYEWRYGSGELNHYTQVMWRSTKSVGCGHHINPRTGCQVIVCRYWPPGNIMGRNPW